MRAKSEKSRAANSVFAPCVCEPQTRILRLAVHSRKLEKNRLCNAEPQNRLCNRKTPTLRVAAAKYIYYVYINLASFPTVKGEVVVRSSRTTTPSPFLD